MSIGLSVLLLTAASAFLFSVTHLWMRAEADPDADHHVSGVTQFVEWLVTVGRTPSEGGSGMVAQQQEGMGVPALPQQVPSPQAQQPQPQQPTAGTTGGAGSTSGQRKQGVVWGWPPGVSTLEPPSISFRLEEDVPLLVWEKGPRPAVTCYLVFREGEGLSLLWQTDRQRREEEREFQRTLISPHVTAVSYLFYDSEAKTWSETAKPEESKDGQQKLPDMMKLTFSIDGRTETTAVLLPPRASNSGGGLVY